uniref:Uncharacterized protein n=1 Tax=Caenorhabditis japonica TaxID=281687 RepID=A0A8R1EKY1_CAEJA
MRTSQFPEIIVLRNGLSVVFQFHGIGHFDTVNIHYFFSNFSLTRQQNACLHQTTLLFAPHTIFGRHSEANNIEQR